MAGSLACRIRNRECPVEMAIPIGGIGVKPSRCELSGSQGSDPSRRMIAVRTREVGQRVKHTDGSLTADAIPRQGRVRRPVASIVAFAGPVSRVE